MNNSDQRTDRKEHYDIVNESTNSRQDQREILRDGYNVATLSCTLADVLINR